MNTLGEKEIYVCFRLKIERCFLQVDWNIWELCRVTLKDDDGLQLRAKKSGRVTPKNDDAL